jgi:hypothetical protein
MAGEMNTLNPGIRVFSRMLGGALSGDPGMLGMIQGKGAPSSLVSGLAEGGDISNYRQDQAALNINELPTLNVNTGEQVYADRMAGEKQMNPLGNMVYKMASMGSLKPTIGKDKQTQDFFYSPHIQYGTDPYANNPQWAVPARYAPNAPAFTLNPSTSSKSAQDSAFVNRS